MRFNISLRHLIGSALLMSAAAASAADSEWHFKVTNDTDSKIVELEVSENRKDWGGFDVGRGIKAGATETMVWDASTDDESCEQWIRAKFADGSTSKPSKFDFCRDLEDPIVFSD